MTSNLSSGHCKGGAGVTEGKAATMAGDFAVLPGDQGRAWVGDDMLDERCFVSLAEAGVHWDA